MHSNLFFPAASSLFFVIITIMPCFCQEIDQYTKCGESFQCASIQNLSYPFWGANRPDYCGHSAFELNNCQGDVPLITIDSISYRVLSVDKSMPSLTVARADLWNNTCPTRLVNTTLDSTPFISSSTNQILAVYYGCTAGIVQQKPAGKDLVQQKPAGKDLVQQTIPAGKNFSCQIGSFSYFTVDLDAVTNDLMFCNSSVRVPVNGTWGQALNSTTASMGDLEGALASGFVVQWNASDNLCNQCQALGGLCGSSTGSNSFACYCADGVYDSRCDITAQNGPSTRLNLAVKLAIGFSISGGAVITIIFIIILCYRRRRFQAGKNEDDKNVEAFLRNHGSLTLKRYAYYDIKKMTNSFSDKLGEGGYGSVFKGKLSDNRLVAVKMLTEIKGNGGDFVNEVASISRTSHVNIVTLLGFCLKGNKRALVYEFMPNKSLDKFIRNNGSSSLDWETLYRIAVGTARGLEYLHRGCNTRIVHFDIKPENILLDEDFCPKISDFGLAKLCQRKKSIVSMMGARGTPGYIAPEVFCRNFGEVSYKSDVYSYGMMVIKMVGVERKTEVGSDLDSTSETYFPDFIYKRLERGEDLRIFQGARSEEEEETARKMVMVSLWCIQTNPSDRPSMSRVVEMLEGSIELLRVPPKPFLFSPMRANQDSFLTLSGGSCEIEQVEST